MIRVANLYTGPARCKLCGERIVWALSDIDRRIPVDAQSTIDPLLGAFVLWFDDPPDDEPQRVSSVAMYEARTGQKYTGRRWSLHAATCAGRLPTPSPQLTLFKGGRP